MTRRPWAGFVAWIMHRKGSTSSGGRLAYGAASAPALVKLPRHVGIIMDGNGRWAQARGLPRVAGHRAGTDNLRRILTAAVDFGVPILTLYAFSTENWGRPAAEVQALMLILRETLTNELPELHKNGVRIRHIGRKQPLDPALLEAIRHAEEVTRDNSRLVLNVALNYGGRADIVDACRAIVRAGIPAEQIDEAAISAHLSTAGLDDPDLIIRTAGEMRLSNFVIWQAAYAEYYSTPVYWPDFDRDAFYQALVAFQQRDRRFGKLNS